jgi:hypothetical protein
MDMKTGMVPSSFTKKAYCSCWPGLSSWTARSVGVFRISADRAETESALKVLRPQEVRAEESLLHEVHVAGRHGQGGRDRQEELLLGREELDAPHGDQRADVGDRLALDPVGDGVVVEALAHLEVGELIDGARPVAVGQGLGAAEDEPLVVEEHGDRPAVDVREGLLRPARRRAGDEGPVLRGADQGHVGDRRALDPRDDHVEVLGFLGALGVLAAALDAERDPDVLRVAPVVVGHGRRREGRIDR